MNNETMNNETMNTTNPLADYYTSISSSGAVINPLADYSALPRTGHFVFPDYMVPDQIIPKYDDYVDYRDHLADISKDKDTKTESVNHPEYYSPGTYEAINIIEHYGLGFSLGNAIKYILRAGIKDPSKYTEDLEKAIWYINREIIRNA